MLWVMQISPLLRAGFYDNLTKLPAAPQYVVSCGRGHQFGTAPLFGATLCPVRGNGMDEFVPSFVLAKSFGQSAKGETFAAKRTETGHEDRAQVYHG
jgi:hypothetical protein